MGIRNKFALCLLAVLFPLGAVGVFTTHLASKHAYERTTAALANTQRLEAARIEQILGGYAKNARSLASGRALRDLYTELTEYRQAKSSATSGQLPEKPVIGGHDVFPSIDPESPWPFQQLAFLTQREAGIAGSNIVEVQLVDRALNVLGESIGFSWKPADQQLVERSMSNARTFFGDAFINDTEHRRLGMVSPILSHTGTVVGALLMESRLGPVVDLIAKHQEMGESIEALIAQPSTDGEALIITPLRFEQDAAFNKLVPAEPSLAAHLALQSPDSQIIKSRDYRGVESYMALQTIAQTGWGLIVKVDAAETYAPVNQLRSWLNWATLASIASVALVYLFFLIPVVRRLNKSAAVARDIMAGNLEARVTDTRNDEITSLAASINSLARDLELDQKMRSKVEAQLRHQAAHDELTGLLNRKHANKIIKELGTRPQQENAVMFLDLNGFKDVNDLYGHTAGDQVLIEIANRLGERTPEGATLARWGGDEFVVILPGVNDSNAAQFAEELNAVFEQPIQSAEGTHAISCSIGLATSSTEKSLHDALLEADDLMYEEKKRQRLLRSKGGSHTKGLESALKQGRMEMWFQPAVEVTRDGAFALIGAGAQLRMRDVNGKHIMSSEFLRDLRAPSVLQSLDNRALELSLGTLKRWNNAGVVDERFRLSVALSDIALEDPTFPSRLAKKLSRTGVQPDQLQIEINMEAPLTDNGALKRIRNLGVCIAFNGVGSELNLLRQVPLKRPTTARLPRFHS